MLCTTIVSVKFCRSKQNTWTWKLLHFSQSGNTNLGNCETGEHDAPSVIPLQAIARSRKFSPRFQQDLEIAIRSRNLLTWISRATSVRSLTRKTKYFESKMISYVEFSLLTWSSPLGVERTRIFRPGPEFLASPHGNHHRVATTKPWFFSFFELLCPIAWIGNSTAKKQGTVL